MNRRERYRRMLTLKEAWATRLGIDSMDGIEDELTERFEHLSRFVLAGPEIKPGQASAEAATAYGELWMLAGFLADARRLLVEEESRR